MRALLLVSILSVLLAGAYLWHVARFTTTASERPAAADAIPAQGPDLVLEIGGGPPAGAPAIPAKVSAPPKAKPNTRDATPPAPDDAQPDPKKAQAPKSDEPAGDPTVKFAKGMTIYSLAVKNYGSGSPAVIRDIVGASHISDETKIREGATIVLPAEAGGRKRKS